MEDSSLYWQIKAQVQQSQPQLPEQEHLKCPRCDSTNTKFCYYNNYSLCQPRHFCKSCKRYWTKGGVLRNVPIGGGSRKKAKRNSSSSSSSSSTAASAAAKRPPAAAATNDKNHGSGGAAEMLPLKGRNFGGQNASFLEASRSRYNSLLEPREGRLSSLLDGLGPSGDPRSGQNVEPEIGLDSGRRCNTDGFLKVEGGGEGGDDGGSNGWPDLCMYTPGPTFQ